MIVILSKAHHELSLLYIEKEFRGTGFLMRGLASERSATAMQALSVGMMDKKSEGHLIFSPEWLQKTQFSALPLIAFTPDLVDAASLTNMMLIVRRFLCTAEMARRRDHVVLSYAMDRKLHVTSTSWPLKMAYLDTMMRVLPVFESPEEEDRVPIVHVLHEPGDEFMREHWKTHRMDLKTRQRYMLTDGSDFAVCARTSRVLE